jgi:hypothetical protein
VAKSEQYINGNKLKNYFNDVKYKSIIFSSKVASDPTTALEKIEAFYGQKPTVDGSNIQHIKEIRDFVVQKVSDKKWLRGLTIMAPHTHWDTLQPTIYNYQNDKYIIGPHKVLDQQLYTPVSFVFSIDGPIPYEWTDQSVLIEKRDWNICYDLIYQVNDELKLYNIPLGLTIDFRFKNSLFEIGDSSLEVPIEELNNEFYGFSRIESGHPILKKNNQMTTEQVSWHALSDLIYDFTSEELLLLEKLNSVISAIGDPEEKRDFIKKLEAGIRKD